MPGQQQKVSAPSVEQRQYEYIGEYAPLGAKALILVDRS